MPSLASMTYATKPFATQQQPRVTPKFSYTPGAGAAQTDANGAFAGGGDLFNMGGQQYSANDILSRYAGMTPEQQNGLYGDTLFNNALSVNMGRDAANRLIQQHSAGGDLYDPNAAHYSWQQATAAPAMASPTPQSAPNMGGGMGSPAPGGDPYALDINKYLAPNTSFLIDQGSKALQNSAAARGGLLSGNTLKGISDYAQNTAQSAYGNAANIAQNQQAFQYGMDNNDRNFAYNAAVGDRNFNNSNLMSLAQMGLNGAQGSSALSQWLGTILSNNGLSAGQVGANQSIGGSNVLNSAISQYFTNLLSNGLLRNLNLGGG